MQQDTTSTHTDDIDRVFKQTLLDGFKRLPLETVIIPTAIRYKREGNAEKSAAQRELIKQLRPQDLPEFDQAMAQAD